MTAHETLAAIDVAVVGVAAPRSNPAAANPAASNPAASNPAASNPAVSNPAVSNPEAARKRSPWAVMEDYATLINAQPALHAVRLPLASAGVDTVVARIIGLQPRISAALVIGLDTNAAATMQRSVAEGSGPLVITEIDLLTVTLAAMTISTLRNLNLAPHTGQVVITGADRLPMLGSVLMMSGVTAISSWRTNDAQQFPLHRLMNNNDVLVDLDRCAGSSVAANRIVNRPRESLDHGAVVLPGLLGSLCGHDVHVLTPDMVAACVRALTSVTPWGCTLPAPGERKLVSSIARQMTQTLDDVSSYSAHLI